MKPVVQIYHSLDELNLAVLAHFQLVVEKALADRGAAYVALSGGETPQGLYRLFAQTTFQSSIPWNGIHLFWCDERCVPPDDPESNYGQAKDLFLDRISIPPEHIHRMHGELPPVAGADDYQHTLAKFSQNGHSWPVLDWVLLGMGADGHTASLFPGTINPAEAVSPVIAVTAVYLDRPANRLTVTPLVFNTSRNIVFMVTGENKAPKLAAVLNSPNDPLNLPAQRIRAPEGRLTWFVDGYAAKYLVNEGQRD